MKRVLVVEDDEAMAVALRDGFEQEGYEVLVATDGEAGIEAARSSEPDLMLLDVMLPKLSGHDVCRQLRAEGRSVPIIMLTARSQEIDKVVGLKLGADDYITKPFSFMELLARVEAVLRRSAGIKAAPGTCRFGDVEVDMRAGTVTKAGKPVELSARELKLLCYFIGHKNEVLSRDALLDAVWDYDEAPLTRTVDVHVAKLRKKLKTASSEPEFIVTVHRMGYKFVC